MDNLGNLEQNFAKDLSNLSAVVNYASEILLTGSRSQRRPDLGKMVNCIHCGHRRLQGAEKCCNPNYLIQHESMFSKPMLKKFRHKRHGQTRANAQRAFILLLMENEHLVHDAAKEMRVSVPARENIPAFGAKYWLWKEDRVQRFVRQGRDRSRRINREGK